MAQLHVPILVDWDDIKDYMARSDVVEVVRCKDCKHKYLDGGIWNCPFGLSGGPMFYCGYGAERSEG